MKHYSHIQIAQYSHRNDKPPTHKSHILILIDSDEYAKERKWRNNLISLSIFLLFWVLWFMIYVVIVFEIHYFHCEKVVGPWSLTNLYKNVHKSMFLCILTLRTSNQPPLKSIQAILTGGPTFDSHWILGFAPTKWTGLIVNFLNIKLLN